MKNILLQGIYSIHFLILLSYFTFFYFSTYTLLFIFSPDNFARFFCPKQPMFNKVMDIIIEDLQYISFPMPCTSESPLNNCSNDDSLRDDLSMFNVVVATVRESALKRTLNRPYSSERRKPGEDPVSELLGLSNRRLPLKKEILKRFNYFSHHLFHYYHYHHDHLFNFDIIIVLLKNFLVHC